MPTTYVTDAVLLLDVANSLTLDDSSQLPARWTQIVKDANQMAVADITNILINKGYTQAQIDGWDDRVQSNRKLGLWYALTMGNPLGNYPDKFLDKLDPREFLTTAGSIRIGGVPTGPTIGATAVGGIEYGTATTTRTELLEDAYVRGYFPRP
jgi:hypothetical protein